jgi:hypothetical protein
MQSFLLGDSEGIYQPDCHKYQAHEMIPRSDLTQGHSHRGSLSMDRTERFYKIDQRYLVPFKESDGSFVL